MASPQLFFVKEQAPFLFNNVATQCMSMKELRAFHWHDRWLMNGQPVLQKHLLSTNGKEPEAEVKSATMTIRPFSRNGGVGLLPRWAQICA